MSDGDMSRQGERVNQAVRGWVGCYTNQSGGSGSGGIGRLTIGDPSAEVALAAQASDPSYLALSPDKAVLYAVHEGQPGAVSAFAVTSRSLSPLGSRSTHGDDPCHLSVHPLGGFVLVANYSSGSVCVLPVGEGGRLGEATDVVRHEGSGPDRRRQEGPHAHMACFDPAGEWVFVADLGVDAVVTYALDLARGSLAERGRLALPPGTGPRHLAFHPSGLASYVVGELDSTLTVCAHVAGELRPVSTVLTQPPQAEGANLPAAVVVAPDARHLYVSNRGDDTVATFALDADGFGARLVATTPAGGSWPRDLVLSADGRSLLVACERSHRVSVMELGPDGHPRGADGGPPGADGDPWTEQATTANWPAPTCIVLESAPQSTR